MGGPQGPQNGDDRENNWKTDLDPGRLCWRKICHDDAECVSSGMLHGNLPPLQYPPPGFGSIHSTFHLLPRMCSMVCTRCRGAPRGSFSRSAYSVRGLILGFQHRWPTWGCPQPRMSSNLGLGAEAVRSRSLLWSPAYRRNSPLRWTRIGGMRPAAGRHKHPPLSSPSSALPQ